MCRKIQYNGEYEKIYKIFWELNKAQKNLQLLTKQWSSTWPRATAEPFSTRPREPSAGRNFGAKTQTTRNLGLWMGRYNKEEYRKLLETEC